MSIAGCVHEEHSRVAADEPSGRDGAGEPGPALGDFQLTFYWIANQADYAGAATTNVHTATCSVITKVPASFASALKLEGTGRLLDGRVVNYHKACGCSTYGCYFVVDSDHPWGIGVQNRPLVPFRSIAVDKNKIAYGSWVYAPDLDGVTIPAGPWGGELEHDGCLQAADTGSAIVGKHIDFFVGLESAYHALVGELPAKTPLRAGGTRCTGMSPPPPPADDAAVGQACYLGSTGSGGACWPVVPLPAATVGYDYPAPIADDGSDRAPIAYLDLQAIPAGTKLAPNFRLDELAQPSAGRFAVVSPTAVARLQAMRATLGALVIDAGFRAPAVDIADDGGSLSRHAYGDAFDIVPVSASLAAVASACEQNGGVLVEYTSHVHCDWRNEPRDPAFFGAALEPGSALEPAYAAGIVERDDGSFEVDAAGFDEGEPLLRWTAVDARGEPIASAVGSVFLPPPGTAQLEVIVGARVHLQIEARR